MVRLIPAGAPEVAADAQRSANGSTHATGYGTGHVDHYAAEPPYRAVVASHHSDIGRPA